MSGAAPEQGRKKPPYLLLFCIGFPIGVLLVILLIWWLPRLAWALMGP